MLHSKSYFSKTSWALLLLATGKTFANESIEATAKEVIITSENDQFDLSSFIQKNLNVTYNCDSAIGTADLFMVGERHHIWGQVGAIGGNHQFGVGFGYRYLIRGQHPSKDWFVGIYANGGNKISLEDGKSNSRVRGMTGVEIGFNRFQLTGTLYGQKPLTLFYNQPTQIPNYQETDYGYSVRLTTYFMQKMRTLGRINPFFVASRTLVNTIKDGQQIGQSPMINLGPGVRWEGSYLAVEGRLIYKPYQESPQFTPEGSVQLILNHTRSQEANYVRSRIQEMPQVYRPSYYKSHKPIEVTKKKNEENKQGNFIGPLNQNNNSMDSNGTSSGKISEYTPEDHGTQTELFGDASIIETEGGKPQEALDQVETPSGGNSEPVSGAEVTPTPKSKAKRVNKKLEKTITPDKLTKKQKKEQKAEEAAKAAAAEVKIEQDTSVPEGTTTPNKPTVPAQLG